MVDLEHVIFKCSIKGIPSVFTCFIPSAAGYSPGCDRWTLQRNCQDAQQVSTNEPDEKRCNQSLGQILHITDLFLKRTKMRCSSVIQISGFADLFVFENLLKDSSTFAFDFFAVLLLDRPSLRVHVSEDQICY